MTQLVGGYEGFQTKLLPDIEKSTGPNICLVELLGLETIASSHFGKKIKRTRGKPQFPRKWLDP